MFDISIIVPTFNRPDVLDKTLKCLEEQETTAAFEVIVVNDGPANSLPKLDFGIGRRKDWKLVQNPCNLGRAATRNKGIQTASGEYILFLDDDIWGVPSLVHSHWMKQKEVEGGIVLGAVPPAKEIENTIWHRYLDKRYARIHKRLSKDALDFRLFFTGNVSMPRMLLISAGQFDETFKTYSLEDSELGFRLQKNGVRYFHVPHAIGYHFYHEDMDSLCRKVHQSGVSAFHFMQMHPEEGSAVDDKSLVYGPWKGKEAIKNVFKMIVYSMGFQRLVRLLLNGASKTGQDWICDAMFPWLELSLRAQGFRQGATWV